MHSICLVSVLLGMSGFISATFCSKRLVKGKWVSIGNCRVLEQNILPSKPKENEVKGEPVTVEQCKSRGGLVAFEKCFTAPVLSGDRSINYTEAEKECKTRKTLLAEIDDGSQQTTIHDYLFSMMPPGRKYVYLWLGMQYNYETKVLEYRSPGKQISKDRFRWDSDYPYKQKSVAIEIGNDGDALVGLWNSRPSTEMFGVLCETDIL